MMTALFLSGCATSRKASVVTEESVRQVSADTLRSEVRQTWTETVPLEEAKLEIPLAELTNLPEKAEYHAKNGRASATVQNKGGTIVVYATCDSLQRQCEYYERQMASYKNALEQQKNEAKTEKERSSNPLKMLLIAFIVGVATGTVLTITTKRIWQKVRNSCTA
nr:MAG TPA: G-rich domain on putative tyrosine kinase [Caudoviricetes sp.]